MYRYVCAIGACICLIQLPVLISIFNRRHPGLLNTPSICIAWSFFFDLLQRTASYFMAFVSVSRAIRLAHPDRILTTTKQRGFKGLVLYTGYWVCVDIIVVDITRWSVPGFSELNGFCTFGVSDSGVGGIVFKVIRALDLIFIWLITGVSWVISIRKLQKGKLRQFCRDASVTAILLIGTHILLKLPVLIDRILDLTKQSDPAVRSSVFMRWQFKLFSQIVCTVVNALLNTIFLYTRSKYFRAWNHDSRMDTDIIEDSQSEDELAGSSGWG